MADAVARRDPGSFRDPSNAVHHVAGRVLRGLDATAAADWSVLRERRFLSEAMTAGRVVRTTEPDDGRALLGEGWAAVLEHEPVPFRSYPYEWTFTMLRDAAVLHLDLLLAAASEDCTMADGTAYNVQWHGTRPVFVDLLSFRPLGDGGPWAGYRQFCQTFLYPLLLQAHRGAPAHLVLRSRVEGVEPDVARRLLGPTGWARKGALRHVYLHALAEQRMGGATSTEVAGELRAAGFDREVTVGLAKGLRKLVTGLRPSRGRSVWDRYRDTCSSSAADQAAKAEFVRRALEGRGHELVWDLGCNDGTYARIAADHARTVVALDADEAVVDRLYRTLRREGDERILPLVVDLLDPSPGLGWRNQERPAFGDRERPDAVLALAVVHHLALGGNVPLAEVVAWLAALDAEIVVEVPHRDDPMVGRLVASKPAGTHDDYELATFVAAAEDHFTIDVRSVLPGGTRSLFHLTPRS